MGGKKADNAEQRNVDYALGLTAAALVGAWAALLPQSLSSDAFGWFAVFVLPPIALFGFASGVYSARVVYRRHQGPWGVGLSSGISEVLCLACLSLLIGFSAFPIIVALVSFNVEVGWFSFVSSIYLFGIPIAAAAFGWATEFVVYQQRQRTRLSSETASAAAARRS